MTEAAAIARPWELPFWKPAPGKRLIFFYLVLIHTLAVRMDAKTIDRLAATGRKKGMGPSTLARMWLLERLEDEK